ncbi:MAG TPA: hypothetical protein VI815_02885 [Candidatus Nanoarchaeia archaeon]|nr:hypothetical protein [Candidatus Nanoarchaeia archaeon]
MAQSSVDQYLLDLEKFKPIFKIQNFFTLLDRRDKVLGAPFSVTAKNINFECKYARRQKLTAHDGYGYFCVFDDHIDEFTTTGAKIISCANCLNHNK